MTQMAQTHEYEDSKSIIDQVNERNRDLLEADEREYGIAFVDWKGGRVDPNKVFKSVANTYTNHLGEPVSLWKSETQ